MNNFGKILLGKEISFITFNQYSIGIDFTDGSSIALNCKVEVEYIPTKEEGNRILDVKFHKGTYSIESSRTTIKLFSEESIGPEAFVFKDLNGEYIVG